MTVTTITSITTKQRQRQRQRISTPVFLYIPNLLGYARIILAATGLYYAFISPPFTITIWTLCCVLDALDGFAARALDQGSKFGILVSELNGMKSK